ncbi:uncharacterized protein P884DRAFT_271098 [Thermothelomyces heterothallicus CBS 202.75]|uniref:uncharacterized protein n=1 Tax=Thermothelomyces heterothallicus CBS 202.75 TaxID=1149848 RepID=UPI003743E0D7
MKLTAAVLALASGAMAAVAGNGTVSYTTEVVTAVTTFCPGPTEIAYGSVTYTVTEATTLTITDCPCTIKKPVTTISSVVCHNCPSYTNGTATTASATSVQTPAGTITLPANPPVNTPANPPATTGSGSPPITAGAGRTTVLSGGALAGLLGLAAFVL